MPKRNVAGWAVAAAVMVVSPAWAASPGDELRQMREQLRQLREQYESRLQDLEKRLQQAERALRESRPAAAAAAAPQPPAVAAVPREVAPPAAAPRPVGDTAFNPALSLILGGTYANLSQDPARYQITGLVPSMGEVGPPPRSFSLGESELTLSANIDPYFRGYAVFAMTPDNAVEVEEANIQTLALGPGLTLKAGRFLSAIGYQNEIHQHSWDFVDAPLANNAFLGGRYSEDGVQLRWVAPTDLYIDAGLELGRGRTFPAGPDGGRNKNGVGAGNLFAHLGGDIGVDSAWQLGASYLRTSPQDRIYDDLDSTATTVTNSFNGNSKLWNLNGVFKWAPRGDASRTNLKLQAEYFRRTEDGNLTYDTQAASLGTANGSYRSRQSGWYAQTVYQFMPRWRAGYRYDRLQPGSTRIGLVEDGTLTPADFPVLAGHRPSRNSVMLDWSGSEFSRLRFQLARDRSRVDVVDNQFFVQYIMSLGAHGAHRF